MGLTEISEALIALNQLKGKGIVEDYAIGGGHAVIYHQVPYSTYDLDIFAPINICRHIGDIKDIGRYKVDIVEDKIKLKNPEAIVKKRACNPFERDKYLIEFIEDLKKTDIVIDTTASYQMNMQLNRVALLSSDRSLAIPPPSPAELPTNVQ